MGFENITWENFNWENWEYFENVKVSLKILLGKFGKMFPKFEFFVFLKKILFVGKIGKNVSKI